MYAPPIMTGTNCVVPETTVVKVEMTGCWLIGAALDVTATLEELTLELVETGSVEVDRELCVDEKLPVEAELRTWEPNLLLASGLN